MPYCTAPQVADEFNGTVFTAQSNPTLVTVDRWIEEADSLINSKVGLRYVVPIVNADDLIVIRQIAIYLVSARVRRRLNRTGPEGETAKVAVTDTEKKAMDLLKQIVDATLLLPGSTPLNSGGGVSSHNVSEGVEFKWKRGVVQW